MSKMEKKRNIRFAEGDVPWSARKMILDLLDIGDPPTFTVRELVRAGEAFGLESTAVRTALTRLKIEGSIQQLDRGNYTIGQHGAPLMHRIQGWRDVLQRRREWNQNWLFVISRPQDKTDRTVWRRTVQALALEGFAEAEPGIWIRPDNLLGGVEAMRQQFVLLETAPDILLVQASGIDLSRSNRYARLWNCQSLCKSHLARANRLELSAAQIDTLDLPVAASETLLLGRTAIRAILHDPNLPETICSIDGLARLVDAMTSYELIGKRIWHKYLNIDAANRQVRS